MPFVCMVEVLIMFMKINLWPKNPHIKNLNDTLFSKNPQLSNEWDWSKNTVNFYDVSFSSGKKYWWKCTLCRIHHSYESLVSTRVRGSGCPYFAGVKVGYGNTLYDNYKKLCDDEWDWEKNVIRPIEITVGSGYMAWWVCIKCKEAHSYKMQVRNKTKRS